MNRIFFKDNPWPNGHGIKEFEWHARLEPDSGIWFDLHLESEDYYAEDNDDDEEDEVPEDAPDWKHKIVWNNYHSVILSSTYWGHQGFLAGSAASKLEFGKLPDTTFQVDTLPLPEEHDYEDAAFGIYLLGHDSAADHRIRFVKNAGFADYTVRWSGRIALTYVGEEEYKYAFEASIVNAVFGGIELPEGCSPEEGRLLLETYVSDPDLFVWSPERQRFVLGI
ncbi:hypothetical protein QJ48_20220 [Paenibacillus sp. A3]|uniref:hypothetical protein n=1 Tax=Paenibacillus sp. A3 TaxID=1337054 RepID=UPI0006D5AD69|nr:hypothetical protein [Paenibacillus sp. A3]KPV57770.1 hypothetical protein QJ48_20220 [Paenibacillus sp. A3]